MEIEWEEDDLGKSVSSLDPGTNLLYKDGQTITSPGLLFFK